MPLKALIVEDFSADAELAAFELERAGMAPIIRCVETEDDFVRELEAFQPDVILSDFTLPGFSGLAALDLARAKSPSTPFIFLSGTIGEDVAIESLKRGATDYILKGNLTRLPSAVQRALQEAAERAARVQAEDRLRRSEARFRSFMQHMPGIVFLKDLDGRYTFVNQAAEPVFGRSTDEILGRDDYALVPADTADQYQNMDRLAIEHKMALQSVDMVPGPHGDRHWLTTKFPLEHEGEVMLGGMAVDVTDRVLAEEALRLSERAIEASINPIIIAACGGTHNPILYVNPAFVRLTGYAREEVLGRDASFLHADDRQQPGLEEIRNAIREQRDGHAILKNYRKDGSLFWNDLYVTPVRDPKTRRVTHFVGVQHDVTITKRYQEELEHQANHDALTQLPNRNLLQDRLDQAVIQARRHSVMLTVALIDLDHFKLINDSMGHGTGDQVLIAVAERLTSCLRGGDTVARLGGDEFVVVLCDQEDEQAASQVVQRMVAAIGEPLLIDGQELHVTCSIGLSTYPQHGADAESLLRNADAAMYRVKAQTRNGVQLYASEMTARTSDRLALIAAMRHALERDEFELHYQPQIELSTGRVFGVEALIRWQQPKLGMVPPATFIPIAEESGLIIQIGAWVLQTACAQNKRWQEAGYPPITVAVNLSARQFRQKGIVDMISEALSATGMDARYLELELTESMMMHSVDEVIDTLEELKTLGVQVTVDDFGVGYSSLSYLKRFPVDRLKIDRSFVQDIGTDPDGTAIAQAIIAMGRSLHMRVIAEGVESPDQLGFLRECGCDEAQGFYLGEPMPAAELERVLARSLSPEHAAT